MKNTVIFLVFIVLPLFAVAQKHNVFVIDDSVSMTSNSAQQNKYISKVIKKSTKASSVTFEVRFINGNTSSTGNSRIFKYNEQKFDASKFDAKNLPLQKILHNNKVKRKRKKLVKKILQFIQDYRSGKAQYTNIVSSLVSLSKIKSQEVNVYYFTDGIESSKDFRMLERKPFSSVRNAVQSAQNDVKKLARKYSVKKQLSHIKSVHFLLPRQMNTKTKGSDFIEDYFTEIFNYFSVNNINFETL